LKDALSATAGRHWRMVRAALTLCYVSPPVAVAALLGSLLLAWQGLRTLFFAWNADVYRGFPASAIVSAFAHGLRVDISTVLAANLAYLVLALVPLPQRWRASRLARAVLAAAFLIPNGLLLVLAVADLEIHRLLGRRMTLAALDLPLDMLRAWPALMARYWLLLLLAAVVVLGLGWSFARLHDQHAAVRVSWAWLVVCLALAWLARQGAAGELPTCIEDTLISDRIAVNQLVVSSGFAFLDSLGHGRLQRLPERTSIPASAPLVPRAHAAGIRNVVVLIVESLSAEYVGYHNAKPGFAGYTPFFDSLARQGLYFEHAFANGRRSIEGIPAVLAGVPMLMDEPYLTSAYRTNELHGLAEILRDRGFATAFFHGKDGDRLEYRAFARMAGFADYVGFGEYNRAAPAWPGAVNDEVGGIYDGPFLAYALTKLARLPKPFLGAVFTVSSHEPYNLPPELANRFADPAHPIAGTVRYLDHALERFFAAARSEPWFDDTLFVLTGDHTGDAILPEYNNELGGYRVPLLFYHPGGAVAPGVSKRVVQQVDIVPSILDLLGIVDARIGPFGRSVFSHLPGRAFLWTYGCAWSIEQDHALKRLPGGRALLYRFPDVLANAAWLLDAEGSGSNAELSAAMVRMGADIDAIRARFINGLIDNDWYRPARQLGLPP